MELLRLDLVGQGRNNLQIGKVVELEVGHSRCLDGVGGRYASRILKV